MAVLETCVETVEEARAVECGGASRIELCANLAEQGTTPDERAIAACVAAVRIPVFVMVRPRAGGFVYTSEEVVQMCGQVRRASSLGASGIVTGALTTEAAIDRDAMAALADAVAGLPLTCHRAFDAVRRRDLALETLVALGVSRILTSGGAADAESGVDSIARLVRLAAGRIVVMAGGGIRARNVLQIVARTGVAEVHAHLTTADDVSDFVAKLTAAVPGVEPAAPHRVNLHARNP